MKSFTITYSNIRKNIIMKIANTLSILIRNSSWYHFFAQWIFSPESAAQSLSMVYMEGRRKKYSS